MRRLIFLVALVLAFCGFTALGIWQVERLHWKHALIARVDARVHAEPVALPARADWPQASAVRDEYRRVVVSGEYLQHHDTRIQAVTERGPGWWLLTPLREDGGDTILVNRGFVPDDWKGDVAPPAGHVRVVGLLRMSEPNGAFLRKNDVAHDRWYSRDVAAIAQARGFGEVAPWFVDAERDATAPEWPAGGMTVVRFRDQHLQYALTWFGLALLTAWACWRVYTSSNAGRPRHHS
ncbi:MAG: SURF1 family protein [Proteobacteria bacterium]|nr:SURF1 family protein [Pseudomonadota bacterium]